MTKGTVKGVTKAQIRRFRTLLEAKAEELRTSLGSLKAAKALDRGEDLADLDDLPVQSHEEWIFLNRNNIDVMKRLQAVPWAHYCVTCQEELAEEPDRPRREERSFSY